MTGGVTFHSSEQQLTKLLGGVASGAIQLPDFQRDWVWDDEHVRGLLASVSMSYPIGTLMLLDAGNEDVRFASRPVQGTMNANGTPGHHVFPQRWCKDKGIDWGRMDSIVNKTPLTAETNREAGGRAPSAYLARLERTYGIDQGVLDQRLTTHVIDSVALRADHFDAFYQTRKEQLLRRIESVTGTRILREVADDLHIVEEQAEPESPTVEELTALVDR